MPKEPDIWMPLYINRYFGKTRHLSTLEHGAYLLLLMSYWKLQGPLPDDDIRLARYAALSLRQWVKMRPTIAEFFQIGEGQWVSTRAEKEIVIAKSRSQSARDNALKRYETTHAVAERQQSGRTARVPAEPLPNGCSSPSPTPKEKKEDISVASQPRAIEPEPILFSQPTIADQIAPTNWPRINGKATSDVVDAFFTKCFWPKFPEMKGNKETARKAFAKALKRETADAIMVGVNRYFEKRQGLPPGDQQFTQRASTWLNAMGWQDEIREMNLELGIPEDG